MQGLCLITELAQLEVAVLDEPAESSRRSAAAAKVVVPLAAAVEAAVINLAGAGDARLSFGHLTGDLLALGGALTGAGYYAIGRRVRASVGVWSYATIVYGVAAIVLGLFAISVLTGFIGLIVVFPLLGHATWHAYRAIRRGGGERMFIQPA